MGGALILVAVTKDLVDRGFKAGDLVREMAREVGGSGGGKADMAQAGGSDPSKIPAALDKLYLAQEDWENYADQMLEVCSGERLLTNVYDGWAPRPDWRPVTKFEQRAVNEDRVSHDLMFRRNDLT